MSCDKSTFDEGTTDKRVIAADLPSDKVSQIHPDAENKDVEAEERKKVGLCSMCGEHPWKYKCPKCLVKTCSLPCVKEHKKIGDCDGIRSKTAFISMTEYKESHMLSDYRLLEEIARCCNNHERGLKQSLPTVTKWMMIQLKEARKMQINLKLSPYSFTHHKLNSTFFNPRTKSFAWHILWHFPNGGISLHQKKNHDSKTLYELLKECCESNLSNHHELKPYSGNKEVHVFMKRVDVPVNQEKYHELDSTMSLKEALQKKSVAEFPEFIAVLPQHTKEYLEKLSEEVIPFPDLDIHGDPNHHSKRKFNRARQFQSKRGRRHYPASDNRRNQNSGPKKHLKPAPGGSHLDYSSYESFP